MALRISSIPDEFQYVPLSERAEPDPFTMTIKRLPPRQFTILEDKMAKINNDESISFTTGTFNWAIIKKGVVDWKNMFDEKGNEIKPLKSGKGEILDEYLDMLPLDIITEVANVIVGISKDPENASIYLGDVPNATEKTESK